MLIVLPVLDPDAARACVATLHPELHPALLVIDQSDEGADDLPGVTIRPEPHQHPRDYAPRRNIGVARSMNLAVAALRACRGDLLLWVSTSMRFGPDGGATLVEATDRSELGVVGTSTQWHAVGLRRAAFDLAGLWDENYFCGYYEDTDWRRRLSLASGVDSLPAIDVGGSARDGAAYDVLRAANPGRQVINFDALKAYYARKWGGCPPESVETFDRPWGDRPLDYWEPATREELIERYDLGVG